MTKQIPSQFVEDEEFERLQTKKIEMNWTWKQLILSVMDEDETNTNL